jgi:hypothetical protein
MTDQPVELQCANCGQPLDATDKFCRECGLPTVRNATERKLVQAAPPDTAELRRALNVMPDPKPFERLESEDDLSEEPTAPNPRAPDTTGSVIQATNPTFAAQMASSTLLMVGIIVLLASAGIVLLVMAFR